MKKALLIGATGQLGTKVFEKLACSGKYATRIFVREDSRCEHLQPFNPEICFGDLTDKKLATKKTPAFMMKFLGNVFSAFSTPVSNIVKLNYLNAIESTAVDCRELAQKLNIRLTSPEEYLRSKATG